jgi:TonB dependent receptor
VSLVKVDVVATDTHRLLGRYNGQRETTAGSSVGGISTEEHGRYSKNRANDVVGTWTWLASPRMANEVRGSWSTSLPDGGCTFATRNPPGTWFERAYPGALFGCPVNFGAIGEHQFELVENFSWTSGRHDLKLGGQAAWTRSFGDIRNVRDGRYSFERDLPFDFANPATHPFSFVIIDGATSWNIWGTSGGLFVQDSWRVTDTLTLNTGIRYDLDASLTALNPLVRIDKGLHTFALDPDNVSPRIGAAWLPFGDARTLVRGGAGLYYDQNHNNVTAALILNNILVDRLVFIHANVPQLNPFWPDIAAAKRFLAEGLARNAIPDLSTLNGIPSATNDVDRELEIPATRQVSAGIVHTVGWMSASVDVMFRRGVDLYVIRDVNLDPATFQRINPNYSAISAFGNGGESSYKALQVQANVIPNARHLLKLAYTLARNRSNTNATLSSGSATNPFDYSEDEGPSDNDVRHVLAVNGITSLPFDVQLSGILSYRGALPYSATTNAPRPDGKPFAYRPEPRNSRRGDSAFSVDARVAKTVRLPHRASAMVLAEMFNLTNTVNYADYIGTITSSQFGTPTTAGPKRRLQLGFRVDF